MRFSHFRKMKKMENTDAWKCFSRIWRVYVFIVFTLQFFNSFKEWKIVRWWYLRNSVHHVQWKFSTAFQHEQECIRGGGGRGGCEDGEKWIESYAVGIQSLTPAGINPPVPVQLRWMTPTEIFCFASQTASWRWKWLKNISNCIFLWLSFISLPSSIILNIKFISSFKSQFFQCWE